MLLKILILLLFMCCIPQNIAAQSARVYGSLTVQNINIETAPWQGIILVDRGPVKSHCGAVIIAPNAVLTKTWCVQEATLGGLINGELTSNELLPAQDISFYAGISCRDEYTTAKRHRVSEIKINSDLAILLLQDTIKYTDKIKNISYKSEISDADKKNSYGFVYYGFGVPQGRVQESCLSRLDLKLPSTSSPYDVVKVLENGIIQYTHIISQNGNRGDTLWVNSGDWGGSLIRIENDEPILYGIGADIRNVNKKNIILDNSSGQSIINFNVLNVSSWAQWITENVEIIEGEEYIESNGSEYVYKIGNNRKINQWEIKTIDGEDGLFEITDAVHSPDSVHIRATRNGQCGSALLTGLWKNNLKINKTIITKGCNTIIGPQVVHGTSEYKSPQPCDDYKWTCQQTNAFRISSNWHNVVVRIKKLNARTTLKLECKVQGTEKPKIFEKEINSQWTIIGKDIIYQRASEEYSMDYTPISGQWNVPGQWNLSSEFVGLNYWTEPYKIKLKAGFIGKINLAYTWDGIQITKTIQVLPNPNFIQGPNKFCDSGAYVLMRGNTNYGNALPAEWRLQVYGINSDNYRVLTLPDKVLLVANNYTNTTNIKLYLIKDSEVIAHKIIQHQCDIIGPDFLMQGETAQYTIPPYNPIVNWTLNNTIKFVITDEENTNSAHVYARGTFPGQTTLTASNPTNNSIISSKVIAYIETQQVALSIARNANGWDTIKLFSAPNQICLPIHRDSILKNIANYNAQHYWYANRRDITTGLDAVNNVFNYRIQKDDNHIALNLRYGSIGSAKVFIKINLSANDMTYNITESFCYIYYTSDENKNQFISLLNQYAACQCRLNIQSSDIISAAIHSASKQGIITNERDAGIFCMRRRYVDFLREDNEIYLSLSRIAGYTTKFQVVNIHHSKIPEQTCRILNRYITK